MEIKLTNVCFYFRKRLLMILMRTFIFLLCTTVVGFTPENIFSQSKVIINADKEVSVDQVFKIIKEQTEYTFVYQQDIFKNAPKVQLKKGSIKVGKLLNQSIRTKDFSIILSSDNTILIKKRTAVQQRQISGKISDELGNPIPGVTILIKGTKTGTSSDFNGAYTINASEGNVLVFTSIGYQSKSLTVGNSTIMNVTLLENINELEGVTIVATGYQSLKKEELSGAASTINSKALELRTIVSGNFLESLEGRLPGLVYNARNPNTPEDEQLTIRGISTFNGVKSPLIVIDGYPTEISLSSINPKTIASVSVLRDAAASSIYGARAANGVIVITTKRGKVGKPIITFSTSVAVQASPDFSDLNYVKSAEFIDVESALQLASTSSRPSATSTQPSPAENVIFDLKAGLITQEQADALLAQMGQYNNLNEYQDLFYRPSFTQNYELNVSGGSDYNTYRLGVNYIGTNANEKFNNTDRVVINLNDQYTFSDRISVDVGAIYTNTSSSSRGNIPGYASLLPYERILDEDGNARPNFGYYQGNETVNNEAMALGLYSRWRSPYGDFNSELNSSRSNNIRGQIRINAKITNWLNFQLGGALEHQANNQDQLFQEENFLVRDLLNRSAQVSEATGNPLFTHIPQGDILKKVNNTLDAYTFRGQFDFDHTFGTATTHRLSGIIGAEIRKTVSQSDLSSKFGYDGQNLLIGAIDLQQLAARDVVSGFPQFRFGTPFVNVSDYFKETHSDRRTRSYYSQLAYQLNGKYILTGSIRLDQSNLFGSNPKYRNKPQWSVGASWLLHKEGFMQNTSSWLNEFKIRGAYGLTGNFPTSNSGKFLILRRSIRRDITPQTDYNYVLYPENQSLRWENTKNINIGTDFGLFNNRISGSFDWYKKATEQVLGSTLADPTTGFANYLSNTASIENKGIEIWLNSKNILRDNFSWTTGFTASFNANEVTKVFNSNANSFRSKYYFDVNDPYKGYALNTLLSYRYGGLNELGIPTMITKDGTRQMITGSDMILLEDLIASGTTTPKQVFGFNNQISIGNFDFFSMFMFYGGHVQRIQQPNVTDSYPVAGVSNYWKNPGDENTTDILRIKPPFSSGLTSAYSFGNNAYKKANRYVQKADQIRLTDVSVTYNLPEKIHDKTAFDSFQMRFQAQNLWKYNFSDNSIDSDAINPVTGERSLQTQPLLSLSFITQF